jgi:hypothetical protein
MTEQDLIERGEIYKNLMEHPGWTLLCHDIKELIESNMAQVLDKSNEPMFAERGMIKGMTKTLLIPTDAVEEATRIANTKADQA